jgi:ABC-type dipeptide/oligopeptide/nickel transport system ATPase component
MRFSLDLRDLKLEFHTDDGVFKVLDGISLKSRRANPWIGRGDRLRKSVTGHAILGLIPKPAGKITGVK